MNRKRIKFEYDRAVDAAYVGFSRARVDRSEQAGPGIIFDFDATGQIVGVEILGFAKRFLSTVKSKPAPLSRGKPLQKSA